MKFSFKVTVLLIMVSCLMIDTCPAQNNLSASPEGYWSGKCLPGSPPLSFSIRVEKLSNGYKASFSAEEQRALDIPLQKISFDTLKQQLVFALSGDRDTWQFLATVNDIYLDGTITRGDQEAGFRLVKQVEAPATYQQREVTFSNDSIQLSGSLYLPGAAKMKVPAIIFIHGSGSEPRFASAYFADYFARRGFAVLIYDKRGVAKSKGNWRLGSLQDLARDAIAGIRLLEAHPAIDRGKIGVYGHSQGGSICPMLLTMHPALAFGISAASAGVSMEESDWYEVQNRFRRYVSGTDYENAMQIMARYLHFASSGLGYAELLAEAKKYDKEKWFRDYIGTIDSTAFFFPYYRKVGLYNPVDYWKKVKQPVLILKGDKDSTSPGYPSFQNIEDALKQAGNKNYKIVLFPNTSHEMHQVGNPTDFWFRGTPGYADTIYDWLKATLILKPGG